MTSGGTAPRFVAARLAVIFVSMIGILCGVGPVRAEQRIVVLRGSSTFYDSAETGFTDGLQHSGYREGDEVSIHRYLLKDVGQDRSADESANREILRRIQAARPDLVLALGTEAANRAAASLGAIPVVYAMIFAPPTGAHPNMAGVTLSIPPGEQFQAFKSADPQLRSIGIVYDPADPLALSLVADARKGADQAGLTVELAAASSAEEAAQRVGELSKQVNGFWIVPDIPSISTLHWVQAQHIAAPVMGLSDSYVKLGALLALFPDYHDIGDQAAELAIKILKGAEPVSLVARSPRRTLLWVNAAIAVQLHIDIPAGVRDTADHLEQTLPPAGATP
jgi:putative tryptophan/tyrosine transport system substrate-binding protein